MIDESAYGLFRRGSALLSEGLASDAADALAKASEMEPEKASIREALARAYFAMGRTRMAQTEFEAAADIDPTNDYAHFGLALCLERQGRLDEARGHARLACVMQPENDDYRRALSRLERGAS